MLKAEQIPDEVFEAFQKAWAVTSTLSTKECLAAAINAWPGVNLDAVRCGTLILPLPQEKTDDA
jgi:hypothetical protein